ncbi:hypothetical protein TEA_014513 [Camellia sinensis var. sinensis]|uniref:WAT1-related protein n=1 Tax=Camellia sinensis var. sinensis TaxID=542762 RepID=A0A4S4ESN4_CAMSN|nr:hypothetical protein TEA_014513 [Camellia sinensis var. sinensis]
MVIVQVGYAGMNILSKLAMDSGMNPFIHVAYRQVFATIVIAPFAYFLERKTSPRMTLPIFFQMFLCSIFGITMNQVLYLVGLHNSTPTIACALTNLLPAVTFILAVPFGITMNQVLYLVGLHNSTPTIACALTNLLPAVTFILARKGPLYVSVFNPLLLVIVAILSWGLLEEKLYVGTVVGSGLIVMALYAVLWGKNKEMNAKNNAEEDREEEKQEVVKSDLEMQFFGLSNGNHNLHTIKS